MENLHQKFISENKLKISALPAELTTAIAKFKETSEKVAKMKAGAEKEKAEASLLTMDKSILDQLEDFSEETPKPAAAPAAPAKGAKKEEVVTTEEESGGGGLAALLIGIGIALGLGFAFRNRK